MRGRRTVLIAADVDAFPLHFFSLLLRLSGIYDFITYPRGIALRWAGLNPSQLIEGRIDTFSQVSEGDKF